MTIPHKLSITLALAASLFTGCVPHRLYNERPGQYLQTVTAQVDDPVRADLAIIEFDDHGILWKREQLEETLELIRSANREAREGTLVMVYIHGWQNNADLEDPRGSLARFRASLRNNADQQRQDTPVVADRIVGVFLGWRGDTSNIPIHDHLTFWDRRRAADRDADG